ncbi:hypothetical protein [Bacillus sp. S/N-304-OC-R1]|uniref:hypothetical protein n=1 Tax=Bacillus sp. S/N-304-OC-R1 TaxID=2758034 RepID=UPI001C8D7538|nr:hypothetical protein [Bacillus sp. S/N-304-OC-R1]MBY0120823.1 hypothetical protein [Bacillus sp. S/N-304-OC-R1]
MRRFIYLYMICLLVVTTGCHKDKPKPETKFIVEPMNVSTSNKDVAVTAIAQNSSDQFYVNHQVKGKNLFIECIVPGITFRETNASNKGSIILYIDGQKKDQISSAAFIVKGLSAGTHKIKLEVLKDNETSSILKREFYVTIP